MTHPLPPKRIIVVATVVAVLTNCSGNFESAPNAERPAVSGVADSVQIKPLRSSVSLIPGRGAAVPKPKAQGRSWMDPSAKKRQALLYVSNSGNGTVTVYSYNARKKPTLTGTLTGFGFPTAPCTDNRGNVFIPDFASAETTEYAYGVSTPSKVLADPDNGEPTGCSVDSKTGNLAVVNILAQDSPSYGIGNVTVYPGATGTPTIYNNPDMVFPEFAGYDANGNLYIDGRDDLSSDATVKLAELPFGKSSYENLTINGGEPYSPGQVQWGRRYLLVGDMGQGGTLPSYVHQVTVSRTVATIVNTILLKGTFQAIGYKHGSGANATFVAPDVSQSKGFIFAFPAGKKSSMFGGTNEPFGAVVVQEP
jgi:hypothetical protein